ncbi:hypothetical protein Pla8534_64740 [Lignipirellula cremea]|uniref:Uncharacterized protein n=2 Tax=Lignipirellula cremea TaxID=2528010 RepID=A0A518E3H8_9BACT|nr:hypothetical protein Pla8534_64740 [Lignipirellula cremea]
MSIETRHTPGPWRVEAINGGETYQVTTCEPRHFTVVAELPFDLQDRDLANAQLIAAAPQLLAALIIARDELAIFFVSNPADQDTKRALNAVRAAIRKAEPPVANATIQQPQFALAYERIDP